MDYCKYIHYEIEYVSSAADTNNKPDKSQNNSNINGLLNLTNSETLPSQWINVDLRYFDFRVIGKYDVIMLDPPWDIHMNVFIKYQYS